MRMSKMKLGQIRQVSTQMLPELVELFELSLNLCSVDENVKMTHFIGALSSCELDLKE